MPFLWTHPEPAEDSIFGQKHKYFSSHPKGHFAHSHKVNLPMTFIQCLLYHKWEPDPFWWDSMAVSHGVCTFRSAGFLIGNCSISWRASMKDSLRPVTTLQSLSVVGLLSSSFTYFYIFQLLLYSRYLYWYLTRNSNLLLPLRWNCSLTTSSLQGWVPELIPYVKGLFRSK